MIHTINQIILTAQNYELLETDVFAAFLILVSIVVVPALFKECAVVVSINEWKKSLKK